MFCLGVHIYIYAILHLFKKNMNIQDEELKVV